MNSLSQRRWQSHHSYALASYLFIALAWLLHPLRLPAQENSKSPTSSIRLQLNLAIEDSKPADVTIKLNLSERALNRTIETKTQITTGPSTLTFSNLVDGQYYLYISAPGYATQWQHFKLKDGSPSKTEFKTELCRKRYVILRYAFNTSGSRELTGDRLEEGRAAVAHWGGLPYFRRDWQIWQRTSEVSLFGDTPYLEFHRYADGFGFSKVPENTTFESLQQAPENGYLCARAQAVKGLLLFCRVNGDRDEGLGYGKIMVEDITETPPAGIKVIEGSY